MADVLTIEECPKCGGQHRYELHVVRTPIQDTSGTAEDRQVFRTRFFRCPTVNESFQYRFPLQQDPHAEIIELRVGNVINGCSSEEAASGLVTRVFVSYSRTDEWIVTPIVHVIRAVGLSVFQDIDSIPYGKRWRPVIESSVKAASVVLVFWCGHARDSLEVRKEWELAATTGKDVVPTLLDDTPIVRTLAEYQYVDLRSLFPGHSEDSKSLDPGLAPMNGVGADLRRRLFSIYKNERNTEPDVFGMAAARIWSHLEDKATLMPAINNGRTSNMPTPPRSQEARLEQEVAPWFVVGHHIVQLWNCIMRQDARAAAVMASQLGNLASDLSFNIDRVISAVNTGSPTGATDYISSIVINPSARHAFYLGTSWESLYNAVGLTHRERDGSILHSVLAQVENEMRELGLERSLSALQGCAELMKTWPSGYAESQEQVDDCRRRLDHMLKEILTPELEEHQPAGASGSWRQLFPQNPERLG